MHVQGAVSYINALIEHGAHRDELNGNLWGRA